MLVMSHAHLYISSAKHKHSYRWTILDAIINSYMPENVGILNNTQVFSSQLCEKHTAGLVLGLFYVFCVCLFVCMLVGWLVGWLVPTYHMHNNYITYIATMQVYFN